MNDAGVYQKEPTLLISAVTGMVQTLGTLLVAFGFELTTEQLAATVASINAMAVLIGAITIRSQVFSPARYAADIQAVAEAPRGRHRAQP